MEEHGGDQLLLQGAPDRLPQYEAALGSIGHLDQVIVELRVDQQRADRAGAFRERLGGELQVLRRGAQLRKDLREVLVGLVVDQIVNESAAGLDVLRQSADVAGRG